MRVTFLMKCSECGNENYLTEKEKKNNPDRLELKKYCPKCRKMTIHKEKTKK
nr:50S ribosomal protein L33 [Bacilli bacterium]